MKTELQGLLQRAIKEAGEQKDLLLNEVPPVILEIPKRKGQGDIATTIAMMMASKEKKNPKEIAGIILKHLSGHQGIVEKVEIAGPGFLNFTMTPSFWYDTLREIEKKGTAYGKSEVGKGISVQIEFVSANPTGPLHVGHGRGAAVGDVLANLLEANGYQVDREYYINNVGKQMDTLARSTFIRYQACGGKVNPLPDGYYQGDYISEIAKDIFEKEGDRFLDHPEEKWLPFFREYASNEILKRIRSDLDLFGVPFDRWFSEKELFQNGEVDEAFKELKARGALYEADGALWLSTTRFGDDKDRVVVRENGQQTYFASDIAYHRNKYQRGYKRVINIWGADHHGYVPRMKAMVQALGYPLESFQVVLVQLVNLLRDQKPVAMSTRAGEFVTLREVIEEVGSDVARYFFLMRRSDTPLDFDLELAKKSSNENPVYYVQYANARICSLFRQAKERGIDIVPSSQIKLERLELPQEFDLIKQLALYPSLVLACAVSLESHRLTFYLQELASQVHQFYYHHRIITQDKDLTQARLFLMSCIQIVIGNILKILGVSAPERM